MLQPGHQKKEAAEGICCSRILTAAFHRILANFHLMLLWMMHFLPSEMDVAELKCWELIPWAAFHGRAHAFHLIPSWMKVPPKEEATGICCEEILMPGGLSSHAG
mmetsp:Transcript_160418/g.307910  ORF Transcript_160418/g.307910 Transcript_160418/m.307910 type:complete len:105 (-) Transcript_160418:1110-1424(-)